MEVLEPARIVQLIAREIVGQRHNPVEMGADQAAVNQGKVAEVDAAMIKLQCDFFYIRHCSLWLDALIFSKSISTVVTGFGSR